MDQYDRDHVRLRVDHPHSFAVIYFVIRIVVWFMRDGVDVIALSLVLAPPDGY